MIDLTLAQRDPAVLVSVLIPTFNRQNLLKRAVNSVLSQSFDGFQLVVADNGSTDGTLEWLLEVQGSNANVVVLRSDVNVGPTENFNKLLRAVRGKYSCFLADDDWHGDGYLRQAVDALESDNDAVLAVPTTRWFAGNALVDASPRFDPSQHDVTERLVHYFSRLYLEDNSEMFGVWRSDMLPAAGLFSNTRGGDALMVAKWLAMGRGIAVNNMILNRSIGGLSSDLAELSRVTNDAFENYDAAAQSLVAYLSSALQSTAIFRRSVHDHDALVSKCNQVLGAHFLNHDLQLANSGRWSRSQPAIPLAS